jgi:hypothetical protein
VEQTAVKGRGGFKTRLSALFPSGWQVPEVLRRFYARAAWLQQLVAEELRLSETEGKYVRNGFDH